MEKEFVTYEIAKKLKELDFDKMCLAWYRKQGNLSYFNPKSIVGSNIDIHKFDDYLKAPLWQQAIDWLREEHGKHIELQKSRTKCGTKYEWWFYIYSGYEGRVKYFPDEIGENLTFPQAREKAILKALETIKNNNERI